jgi:hypothetical protein
LHPLLQISISFHSEILMLNWLLSSACISTISCVARSGLKAQGIRAAWLELPPRTVKVNCFFLPLAEKILPVPTGLKTCALPSRVQALIHPANLSQLVTKFLKEKCLPQAQLASFVFLNRNLPDQSCFPVVTDGLVAFRSACWLADDFQVGLLAGCQNLSLGAYKLQLNHFWTTDDDK